MITGLGKLKLVRTCTACPEQYDAYLHDGLAIGYLRLRHGHFTVDYLPTGEEVYTACPQGDGLFTPDERHHYLNEACKALLVRHANWPKYEDPNVYYEEVEKEETGFRHPV